MARYLNVEEDFRADVLVELLLQLEQIKNWFESQQKYQFFSSSLLFVYEGDITSLNGNNGEGGITLFNGSVDRNEVNRGGGGDSSPHLVSYSKLAVSDSESIIAASRDLSKMTDNSGDGPVGSVVEMDQGVPLSGGRPETHLPSYRESKNIVTKETEGKVTTCDVQSAILPSYQESNDRGRLTVAQMRERQERLGHILPTTPVDPTTNGTPACVNGTSTTQRPPCLAEVKMIDFTHVVSCNTTDENYLVGLRNLIQQFRVLLDSHSI